MAAPGTSKSITHSKGFFELNLSVEAEQQQCGDTSREDK